MFGTFEPEVEAPLYGTLAPVQSWNPLWVNAGPLLKVLKDFWNQKKLWHKFSLWLRLPGWDFETAQVIQLPEYPPKDRGYDVDLPAAILSLKWFWPGRDRALKTFKYHFSFRAELRSGLVRSYHR